MQEKDIFIKNGIFILQTIYQEKINIIKEDHYIIKYNKKTETILTKYDLKRYIRNILSSDNKNFSNDIESIIVLRYILDNEKLKTLNEIFPNFDLLISTYIKIMNEEIKIDLKEFDYEKLLYTLVKKYIEYMNKKLKRSEYLKIVKEEKELKNDIEILEKQLKKYQIVKKNKFYYETYLNSIEYENEIYENDKKIIDLNIENIDKNIDELKKEYKKIEKKIMIKKQKKLEKLNIEIEYLENEKLKLNKEIEKLKYQNEINIKNNKLSFENYIKDVKIDEYTNYYNELKDINVNNLLFKITDKKSRLNKIIEEISESDYPENHLILKHYCLDNLKTITEKCDLRPKIINDIIKLLNENKI